MPEKNVRLFISSTFEDFRNERELLHDKVFPAVSDFCDKKGIRFTPIDLQWGINQYATLAHNTMNICLQEVKRCCVESCGPIMLLLSGYRYGWEPLPESIDTHDFKKICKNVTDTKEIEVLKYWYKLDENNTPSLHRLINRENRYIEQKEWDLKEDVLRNILNKAGLNTLSATEQEIRVANSYGTDNNNNNLSRILVINRNIKFNNTNSNAFDQYLEKDKRKLSKQKQLLAYVEKMTCSKTITLTATTDETDFSNDYYVQFTKAVTNILIDNISNNLKRNVKNKIYDIYKRNLTDEYLPIRKKEDALLKKWKKSGLMLVSGQVGTGKTSFLRNYIKTKGQREKGLEIVLFLDSSQHIQNHSNLLLYLLNKLLDNTFIETNTVIEYGELCSTFKNELFEFTKSCNVLIVIDGIERLKDGSPLDWLPTTIPSNCQIIISIRNDVTWINEIILRTQNHKILLLDKLRKKDGKKILSYLLNEHGRTLQTSQMLYVLDSFEKDGSRPLYMNLLSAECRLWRSDETIYQLPSNSKELIKRFVQRLHNLQFHEKMLVDLTLGILVVSRRGVSERCISEILSNSDVLMSDLYNNYHCDGLYRNKKIPEVVLSRFLHDISPILVYESLDGELYVNIKDAEVKNIFFQNDYLTNNDFSYYHKLLSKHLKFSTNTSQVYNLDIKYLAEIPYHLTYANNFKELDDLLFSFHFIIEILLKYPIINNDSIAGYAAVQDICTLAIHHLHNKDNSIYGNLLKKLHILVNALSNTIYIVMRRPALLPQQMYNHASTVDIAEDLQNELLEKVREYYLQEESSWFRELNLDKDSLYSASIIRSNQDYIACDYTINNELLAVSRGAGLFRNTDQIIEIISMADYKTVDYISFKPSHLDIECNDYQVENMYWSANGKCLIIIIKSGTIIVYDTNLKYYTITCKIGEEVICSAISTSKNILMTICKKTIFLWTLNDGSIDLLHKIRNIGAVRNAESLLLESFSIIEGSMTIINGAVSDDGNYMILVGEDRIQNNINILGGAIFVIDVRNYTGGFDRKSLVPLKIKDIVSNNHELLMLETVFSAFVTVYVDWKNMLMACGDESSNIALFDMITNDLIKILPSQSLLNTLKSINYLDVFYEHSIISCKQSSHPNITLPISDLLLLDNKNIIISCSSTDPDGSGYKRSFNDGASLLQAWDVNNGNLLSTKVLPKMNKRLIVLSERTDKDRIMLLSVGMNIQLIEYKKHTNKTLNIRKKKIVSHHHGRSFISPEGDRLASVRGIDIIVKSLQNRHPDRVYKQCHLATINSIAWHPNGVLFASVANDGYLLVYDVDKNTILQKDFSENYKLSGLSFNSNGSLLGIVGDNGMLKIIHLQEFSVSVVPFAHEYELGNFMCIAFDDNNNIIIGSDEGIAVLVENNARDIRIIHADMGAVIGVSFTKEGDPITISKDKTCRIWDKNTLVEKVRFKDKFSFLWINTNTPNNTIIVANSNAECYLLDLTRKKVSASINFDELILDSSVVREKKDLQLVNHSGEVKTYSTKDLFYLQ